MMNPWGSKYVEDAKNLIKELILKICISLVYVAHFRTGLTDHCHRVETQLQWINIISYRTILNNISQQPK
jgi:hypothetical protein